MDWATKYYNHLGTGWKVIFGIISGFQKRKSIVKIK